MPVFNSAAYVAYASNAKTQSILCCCPNTASQNIGGGQGLGPQLEFIDARGWVTAGGILLTFDRNVKLADGEGSDKSGITVTDTDGEVLINFLYSNIDDLSGLGLATGVRLGNSGNLETLTEGQQYTLTIPSNTRIMDLDGVKFAGSKNSFTIPITPPLPNLYYTDASKWNDIKEVSLVFDKEVYLTGMVKASDIKIYKGSMQIISFTSLASDATNVIVATGKAGDTNLILGEVYTLEIPSDTIAGYGGVFAETWVDFRLEYVSGK